MNDCAFGGGLSVIGPEPPGRPISGGQAAVIALRMEPLLVWIIERVAKFLREHKSTVGNRLVQVGLDVAETLVEAAYRRDKDALPRRRPT